MSADNGIYIGQFPDGEFRVVHAQAIENLTYEPDMGEFNAQEVARYFTGSSVKITHDREEALKYAAIELDRWPIVEYGISFIILEHPYQTYKDKAEAVPPGMTRFTVEIPEVHKAMVVVTLPSGATRDEIIEAAEEEFEDVGSEHLEYSHTIEDRQQWTVRNEETGYHI